MLVTLCLNKTKAMKKIIGCLMLLVASPTLFAQLTFTKLVCNAVGASKPEQMTAVNGKTVFFAFDQAHGKELWVTNGTQAGTQLLKDINPGTTGSAGIYFAPFNGKLYFNANDGTHGPELWVTDGTAAGTQLVKDINTGHCLLILISSLNLMANYISTHRMGPTEPNYG